MLKKDKFSFGSLLRLLRDFSQGNVRALVFAAVAVLVSTVSLAAVSYSLKILLDNYVLPMLAADSRDFQAFYYFLLSLFLLFACGTYSCYFYNLTLINIGLKFLLKLRLRLFTKMQKLSMTYFDRQQVGKIMSMYTNDISSMQNLFTQTIAVIWQNTLQIVFSLCLMFFLSWKLTLFALAFVFFMYIVGQKLGAYSAAYFAQRQKSLTELTGFLEEQLQAIKIIKSYNQTDTCLQKFRDINDKLTDSQIKATVIGQSMAPLISSIGNLQFVLIALIGAFWATNPANGVTIGNLAAFLQLSRSFDQPFAELTYNFNNLIMAAKAGEHIYKLIDTPEENDTGMVELTYTPAKLPAWKIYEPDNQIEVRTIKGKIVVQHLDFAYEPQKEILHDITFTAEPGEKVALVGSTGAGKTTIINLINRFYEVADDKIIYDGIDINTIKKASLRESMSVVLQESHLFSGTIYDNIRFSRPEATLQEIEAAAEQAQADSFIRRLPAGYDTFIDPEATELSGGQIQLLCIARAILADKPLLILDEATSGIDTGTEHLVQKAMNNLMRGKTVLIIAHRLSTIRNCDKILVMDQGSIKEAGNHKQLLDLKGIYYHLWNGTLELD